MAKKSKDKKYNYYTRTITLPDGKRKYVYGKTKAEVDAKYDEVKAQIAGGINVDDDTTFGEVAKIWLEKYKAPYIRDTTLVMVRCSCNKHIMPYLATLRVRDINSMHVQTVVSQLIAAEHTRASSIISYMRDIFNLAIDLGCIAKNPVPKTLKLPTPSKTTRVPMILQRDVEQYISDHLHATDPARLLFYVGKETGARRGEIFALNWDSIDLDEEVIHVRRNTVWDDHGRPHVREVTKTSAGMRDIPITAALKVELERWGYLHGQKGFLFAIYKGELPKYSNSCRVWIRVRELAAEIDPEFADQFTPHGMRHTYITRLFEAGLDLKEIQDIAGHSDAGTTLSIYTHFDKQSRRETTYSRVRAALDTTPKPVADNVLPFHAAT